MSGSKFNNYTNQSNGQRLTLISHETDFLGLSDSSFRSSMPRIALYRVSPADFPSASHSAALLFLASSPRFVAPSFSFAFWRVECPKPWRSSISNGARTCGTSSSLRWNDPAGLALRVAMRASCIFSAMPMLTMACVSKIHRTHQCKEPSQPVPSLTSDRICSARDLAGSSANAREDGRIAHRETLVVTSTKASSTETAWISSA
jgi:hypothetical protein